MSGKGNILAQNYLFLKVSIFNVISYEINGFKTHNDTNGSLFGIIILKKLIFGIEE